MLISQSLIKEVLKPDHCPKQIYFSFVQGYQLIEPSESMLLGRYFESELIGACRGGSKQEPNLTLPTSLKPKANANKEELIDYIRKYDDTGYDVSGRNNSELKEFIKFMPKNETPGEKTKPFKECDDLILFAKDVFVKIGLDVNEGDSQVDIRSETLSGNIDHRNYDLQDRSKLANYDVKWTATKIDDRWNGWGDPENDINSEIQAAHYTIVTYEVLGKWIPFYFMVFGKDKWVKIFQFKLTKDAIDRHYDRIAHTSAIIREYAENNYKGNGDFNKCISCPFFDICDDKSTNINIETIYI